MANRSTHRRRHIRKQLKGTRKVHPRLDFAKGYNIFDYVRVFGIKSRP
jgi:hypothetical protein